MSWMVILIALVVLAYFMWMLNATEKSDALRDRLEYGFEAVEEAPEQDLTAGDYGLEGNDLFYYRLQLFFTSIGGRFALFSIGAGSVLAVLLLTGSALKDSLMMSGVSGTLLMLLSIILLQNRRASNERKVVKELPNTLELLSAIMEGGMAFESSMDHVIRESDPKHPLYRNLNVMHQAMQNGRRRGEALRLLAERLNIAQISEVTSGLIQADTMGSSLASVMRHHAHTLLRENEAEIQRRAERLPIKMIFPMAFAIIPAIVLIAVAPSALNIVTMIDNIMKGG